MIGGTVVETIGTGDRVWVNCRDTTYGNECAIYVKKDERSALVEPGDIVWWQGRCAMWTPAGNVATRSGLRDIELRRIGYSGASRPAELPEDPNA